MAFTPLTEEEYNKAVASGFSHDQIVGFEKQRKSDQTKTIAKGDDFAQTIQPQNIIGQLFNVPGAAIRSTIQGRGYNQGAMQPDQVPRFQNMAIDATQNSTNPVMNALDPVAMGASAAGLAADIVTNPIDTLGMLIGKVPGVQQAAEAIGATQPMQAVGRFMTKERNLIGHTYRTTKQAVQEADAVLNAPQQEFSAVVKEDIPRKIDETVSSIRGKSDAQLEQLNTTLDETANDKLPVFRKVLKDYFSNNSKIYGTKLDTISDNLAKNGESITRGEFKQILDGVVADAQDQLLDSGKPFEEINLLRKKYKISDDVKESPIVSNNGSPIQTTTSTNAGDELNFKEVVNDIKKVKNALSAKVKMGYRYTPEDIVAAKLMGRWGDYVGTKVPEFAQLNQEYKPIIHAMDLASREFKPNASDFNIKGVKFLKDFALGKNTGMVDRDKLLAFIEQGTENFPGVGDFTKDIKAMGNSINTIKGTTDTAINGLVAKKSQVKDMLSKLSLAKQQNADAKAGLYKAAGLGAMVIGEETAGPRLLRKLIKK